MSANLLELDKSNGQRIRVTRDGQPVDLETAFREGFYVSREDANCVLQLVQNFLTAREQFQK